MTGGPADGGGPGGPVFDPPLSLPTPPPVEGEEGGHRKRVLCAFGAAAALFGAGIVGLSLPTNKDDGVNVKTDDTLGPTTTTGSHERSHQEPRGPGLRPLHLLGRRRGEHHDRACGQPQRLPAQRVAEDAGRTGRRRGQRCHHDHPDASPPVTNTDQHPDARPDAGPAEQPAARPLGPGHVDGTDQPPDDEAAEADDHHDGADDHQPADHGH